MHDSYDDNVVRLDTKVDTERETRRQSAARISMYYGITQRPLGNGVKNCHCLI